MLCQLRRVFIESQVEMIPVYWISECSTTLTPSLYLTYSHVN